MMALKVEKWNGKTITRNGIYSGVEMERYHSGKLCDGPSISSSGLRTIFSESPLTFWINSPLNPNRLEPEDTEAFSVGRAAHHLYLGQDGFDREFVVQPQEIDGKPWQGNRTVCRDWVADQKAAGMTVLSASDLETLQGIGGFLPWQKGLDDSGLANNAIVNDSGLLNGLIEHTIAWKDKETGVWLLSRPDAIPTDGTMAGDLKTTRAGVSDREIQRAIEDYRYDMQGALLRRGMREVAGLDLDSFALAFVMKKPPHVVRVKEVWPNDLDVADLDITAALRTFAKCWEAKKWPAPGGQATDANYTGMGEWARKRADDRRAEMEGDAA